MAPQLPTTGSLDNFVEFIKKNAAQTGAGLEDIARGGMLGLSDAGTSLVRGVGALAMNEPLQDWASQTAAEARRFYNPQGAGGRAGAIIGRLLGEGATSMGGGALVGKGLLKAAPKLAASLEGGNIARQAAVNTLLGAPVDVTLSAAKANQSGRSIPKTVAQDALANIAGGALLGGAAKGIKTVANDLGVNNPRALFSAIGDLVTPTPASNLKPTAAINATPESAFQDRVNMIAQQLVSKGRTPEQAEEGLLNYAKRVESNTGVPDMNKQVAERMKQLQSTGFRGDTLAARTIVNAMQEAEKRPVKKLAEEGYEYGPGKKATYMIGDQPIDVDITPAAGGRITVDVPDIPKEMQGKTFSTGELRNLFKQIMDDEDAKGIASFRRATGNIMVVDRPGVKPEIPNMSNADKQQFFKDIGLENAPPATKQVYLSEYMSGVYMAGEDPNKMKAFLKDMLKENPAPKGTGFRPDTLAMALPRTAAQISAAQAEGQRQRLFDQLPMLDTSDEAMQAGVEAARRAQLPRELPPIPAVGPTTPKIRDFNRLPRLDEEGAALQAARRREAELFKNFLDTPKSPNLLAARIDPEGVAEYIAKTRRLSQYDADRIRRTAELEDAMIAGPEGQEITSDIRDAARQQVEFERAQAEAIEAARKVGKVYDPYAPEPTQVLSANSFDQMTPQQRYDFLQMIRRNAQGMEAMSGGLGRQITWEVNPSTMRQSLPQIQREAARFASQMELPSTWTSFQQIKPPTDVGALGDMTPAEVRRYLSQLTKEIGGTMGKTKPRKKKD